MTETTEIATFGAGCYWCVEAVLEQLDGVLDVTSGFMGGEVENPSYADVCSGTTGHADGIPWTWNYRPRLWAVRGGTSDAVALVGPAGCGAVRLEAEGA